MRDHGFGVLIAFVDVAGGLVGVEVPFIGEGTFFVFRNGDEIARDGFEVFELAGEDGDFEELGDMGAHGRGK